MHYYYAITTTTSPGFKFVDDPPRDSGNSLLARKPNLDKEEKTMIRGTSWSEKGVNITPAATTECDVIYAKSSDQK